MSRQIDFERSRCIFCFKNGASSKNEDLQNINQFLKLFERIVSQDEGTSGSSFSKIPEEILNCCIHCKVILDSYCDIYHHVKCLELQLEWKLMSLVNIMKLADKTPSHLGTLQILRKNEGDNENTYSSSKHQILKSFRKLVMVKCQRRLLKSQPRIVLKRIKNETVSPPLTSASNLSNNSDNTPIHTLYPDSEWNEDSESFEPGDNEVTLKTEENFADAFCDLLRENNEHEESLAEEEARPSCQIQVIRIKTEEESGDPTDDDNDSFSRILQSISTSSESLHFEASPTQITDAKSHKQIKLSNSHTASGKPSVLGYHCGICNFSTKTYSCLRLHKRSIRHQTQQKLHLFNRQTIKTEVPIETPELEEVPDDHRDNPVTPKYRFRSKKKRSYTDAMGEYDPDDNQDSDASFGGSTTRSRSSSTDTTEHFDDDTNRNLKSISITGRKNLPKCASQNDKIWCPICQLTIRKGRKETHFQVMHDKSGVDPSQVRNCRYEGCQAYFVLRQDKHIAVIRQMSRHKLKLHGRTIRPIKIAKLKNPVVKPEKNFGCPEVNCLEKFGTQEDLQSHLKLHGNFNCSFCEVVTTFAPDLAVHEVEAHPPPKSGKGKRSWKKVYNCSRCTRRFHEHRTEYLQHFVTAHLNISNTNEKRKCSICGAQSATNNDNRFLKKHFRQCHKTDGLEPSEVHRCDQCPAYFIKALQLHQHNMKMHVRKKCLECGITFASGKQLKRHMEREHPNCSAFFGTMVFSCEVGNCGRRFASEFELASHKTLLHANVEKDPPKVPEGSGLKCLINEKKAKIYRPPENLCAECGKGYKRKRDLIKHMELHKTPDEWRFQCSICKQKFVRQQQLELHSRKAHGKPIICQYCGESYVHPKSLESHMTSEHKDQVDKN